MASLRFIMDVNDDHPTDARHTNKKDTAPANTDQHPQEPTNTLPLPRHVSSSGLAVEHQQDINQTIPSPQRNRRGPSTRGPKSTNVASSSVATSSLSSSPSSLSTSITRPPARRRSTASEDSMDHTGYGSAASSSSMAARFHHTNTPMRPMPPHNPAADLPMRLTPITGRVSRAKKGVPVHVCDICKPAKTFTRAEHLRRHQLSHQTPGFSCTYPGSPSSVDDGYSQRTPSIQRPPGMQSPSLSGPGTGGVASPATNENPATPGQPGSQRRFSQLSSSTVAGTPGTPHAPTMGGGGSSAYNPQGRSSHDYSYQLSSTVSMMDPSHSSSLTGGYPSMLDYQAPRTTPPSIALVTQGLSLPSLHIPEHRTPDLYHPHDASPWTSSASDSTYSTPVSDIPRPNRFWMPRHRSPTTDWPSTQLLSPYPGSTPRNLQGTGGGLEPMVPPQAPIFTNPFSSSSHFAHSSHQSFAPVFDVMMDTFGPTGTTGQHSILDGSSEGTFRSHHQHSTSITAAHAGDTLVTPTPALPSRLDGVAGLGRQKELGADMHQGLTDTQGGMGLGLFDGMGLGIGGGMGTSGEGGDHGTGILAALDLPLQSGCGVPGVVMAIPLQRPVRAAIPGYLEVYWERVDPVFPVVHRQSFEAEPEDVLRCAMAAVATQFLSNKDDRIRGNQLHEYAWHEAKRVTSWNLQIMQAILLCEYFARFRGRKASTRPSKLFENLYSRVSSLQFFTASSSFPFATRDSALWPVDTTAWSSLSSPASDCSSCASITPTAGTTTSYAAPSVCTLPEIPWGSVPSSYASSTTSSSFGNIPSSPNSFNLDLSFSTNSNATSGFNPNVIPSISVSRPQRSWSSLFSPTRYNPPLASPLFFHTQSQVAVQTYSQALSTLQVLYHNPALIDHNVLAADQHLSAEERWRSWVDTEARRRLLAGCLHLDGHAAIYQQQRRAHDWDPNGMTPIPPVPLFGRNAAPWNASSAEEWSSILAADPGAALTPEGIQSLMPYDRIAILGSEMLRLPPHSSPMPEGDQHNRRTSGQLSADRRPHLQDNQMLDNAPESISLDVEGRINTLFGTCPIANTYLALRHTPLHDLLAVAGDSWVFSQKVLPATSFIEHQRRLKLWADGLGGLSAARATVYAARAIIGFLDRGQNAPGVDRGYPTSPWSTDLSDYWALFVCALICWAYGHRVRPSVLAIGRHHHQRSSSEGSGHIGFVPRMTAAAAGKADEEAIAWLRMVAADDMRLETVMRVRGVREAAGVVGLVRRRLEADCIGGRSRLYVDATGVLRKLDEGANLKWF
ncbi:putative transcription factor TDA9 [Echria macrotheca]|uniref:Transcription factor TDA9 n=1 Tax=Echria macrotheca TaxID=438768 RepID=A0AAJ0B3D3_9PEZI|nr:putative transcription factor TDA9 [Echria macrotheca]